MGIINCVKCGESFLRPRAEEDQLCSQCYCDLQNELNKIDRNESPNDKRRKVENLLKKIPSRAIDNKLAQMAEEIADPQIGTRHFCIGRLKEIEWDDKNTMSVT